MDCVKVIDLDKIKISMATIILNKLIVNEYNYINNFVHSRKNLKFIEVIFCARIIISSKLLFIFYKKLF